ncbi:MAG: hypothetical protein FJ319_06150 [SAR202 cluster bacterium]|nr:hypothetical protein [SAR202 cluster bacterium]
MNIQIMDEPELEFAGGGRHIDMRFGLNHFGPLDIEVPRMRSIPIGIVGTNESIEGLRLWLDRCRGEIAAKQSPYANFYVPFPGFRPDAGLRSTLLIESRTQVVVSAKEVSRLTAAPSNDAVSDLVELFLDGVRHVVGKARLGVVLCAPPVAVLEAVQRTPTLAQSFTYDFHDLLKARAMQIGVPIQLIWPYTYDSSKKRKQKRRPDRVRGQQDEATRAWNLHSALYYKAGGILWRMTRDASQLMSCCVGVSFYKSLDGEKIFTSMAQVFNERGDGLIVRGNQATISKDDRQPHLDSQGAKDLLKTALATYKLEHRTMPARIVIHKTSSYSSDEFSGFRAAANDHGIDSVDFLSLGDSYMRLFREGSHPPLRGTFLNLDEKTHILYTKGSVDFFGMSPGLYVPLPLLVRCESMEQTPLFLAQEVLGLTKMNWNNTQFDGRDPITVRGARQVGAILKYVAVGEKIEPGYGHYM